MSMSYELMMRKKEEIMYATIKGSLTENDGVFSGFSGTNYLALQNQFTLSPTTKAEFNFKINISSLTNNNAIFGSITNYGLYVGVNSSGNLELFVGDNSSWTTTQTGTTTLSTSTDYDIKLNINNNIATLYINGNIELTANLGLVSTNTYDMGVGRGITTSDYFRGSIDINNSYVKVGVKYNLQAVVGYKKVGSPTITDGVVSGFSSANYLYLPPAPSWSNIDVLETFTTFTTSTMNTLQIVMGSRYSQATCCVEITSANKTLFRITYIDSGGTTRYKETTINYVLSANTKYKVKNYFNKQTLVIKSELYDENGIMLASASSSLASDYTSIANIIDFWYGYNTQRGTFSGSIDFNNNNTYIKINNKLWFNGQQA